jgi:hypothetical protein
VSLAGHEAGRHVADANDGQLADLSAGDEREDLLVIPGVAIEQIDGDDAPGDLDRLDKAPPGPGVGGDRLFSQHMEVARKRLADQIGPSIGEREKADRVQAELSRISEQCVGVRVDRGVGQSGPREVPRRLAGVGDCSNHVAAVRLHRVDERAAHASAAHDGDLHRSVHRRPPKLPPTPL